MIDFLRGSVLTTQLGVESVATLRTARVKLLSEKPATLADTADQAIAARVLGIPVRPSRDRNRGKCRES